MDPYPALSHTVTHDPSLFLLPECKDEWKGGAQHKLGVLCTHVHAYCECTRHLNACPPSINKWHQILSANAANSLCKRERALHHGSAVSSQGWQLHKKAWNNLSGFPFFPCSRFTKQIKIKTLKVGKGKRIQMQISNRNHGSTPNICCAV